MLECLISLMVTSLKCWTKASFYRFSMTEIQGGKDQWLRVSLETMNG